MEPMKCLRCGEEFTDPVPPETNPEGEITEIMSSHWCANCNALGNSVLFREQAAYQILSLKTTTGALGFSGMPHKLKRKEK